MPVDINPLPDLDYLNMRLRYDDVHGHLYWRSRPREEFQCDKSFIWWNTNFAHHRADREMSRGYMRVRFMIQGHSTNCQAHRVVWKMAYGRDPYPLIDHIDRDPQNNRIFNLREVTAAENNQNKEYGSRSGRRTHGNAVGVYAARNGKFRSQIYIGKKCVYLGTFETAEQARAAFLEARSSAQGEAS